MAGKKRRERPDNDPRPIAVDDFIYNDPDEAGGDSLRFPSPRTKPSAGSAAGRKRNPPPRKQKPRKCRKRDLPPLPPPRRSFPPV